VNEAYFLYDRLKLVSSYRITELCSNDFS